MPMADYDAYSDFDLNKLTAIELGYVATSRIVQLKSGQEGLPGKGEAEGYLEWYIETPSEKRATSWPRGVWHREEDVSWQYFFTNIREWVRDLNAASDDLIFPLLDAGTIATFEQKDITPRAELPGADVSASTRRRSLVAAWLCFMGVLPPPPP